MAVTFNSTEAESQTKGGLEQDTVAMGHFDDAKSFKDSWIERAKEDYRFVVGDQWEAEDKATLKAAGKPALTLNKIQPLIFLISGTQRQNRSDFKAFPIGEEDSIKADVITYLLKSIVRYCDGEFKLSEAFEDGIICGEGWIEPYISYTDDLINGNLKFRKRMPVNVFADPAAKEYDNSDARYICVETPNISLEQLLELFPESEDQLREIPTYNKTSASGAKITETKTDYPSAGVSRSTDSLRVTSGDQLPYQMIEYHYYEQKAVFLFANPYDQNNPIQKFNTKAEATEAKKAALEILGPDEKNSVKIVKRFVPIPRVKVLVNGYKLDDFESPFYPRYKKIPVFSFYAHWIQAPIDSHELLTQGIVHSLKDPQIEINKRRSQELHHLNSSTNSGWLSRRKGGIVNKAQVEKYGASSGFVLEYEKEKPERIFPMVLSAGHEKLAELANQDIKEISGINTDLLAMNDKASSSGRAIHLRQQQGIMMIQRILDNFSRTQRELGRFLISQIGEVFDAEKAMKVVGEGWIKQHFEQPIMEPRMNPVDGTPMIDTQTGQPEMLPKMDAQGKMVMELDNEAVQAFFQMILNDATVDRYDVVVGEVATSETIKLSNYAMMQELIASGFPIPPDVLINESMLNESVKQKIIKSMGAAQAAMAQKQKQAAK